MEEHKPRVKMNAHCIVFLCDEGYLFPTLVCAKQARNHAPANTDILILVDAAHLERERIARLESASGAKIKLIPDSVIELIEKRIPENFFGRSHISRATLFRFFISQFLDKDYDRVLYLDGDMQVRHSLTELFEKELPDGYLGAAPDWKAFHIAEGIPFGEENRRYMTRLGLAPEQWPRYFNAGMIIASPQTWSDVGSAALDFLLSDPEACQHHDQSALNFVCRDRLKTLSIRWNYLRSFMSLPAYRAIDPAIVHFVGRLKPWDGAFAPWSREEFEPYCEMARTLEGSAVTWRRQPMLKRLGYRIRPLISKAEFSDPVYRDTIDRSLRACGQ